MPRNEQQRWPEVPFASGDFMRYLQAMSADIHSPGTTGGTVSGAMFSQHEGGIASDHLSAQASTILLGTARGQVAGPSWSFRYRICKRYSDIFLVVLFSPLLLPLLLIVAGLVRIGSPGPIFFSHRRIRGHGAFFTIWKFRTMCVNSGELLEKHLAADPDARGEWHRTHKLKNDPRITRIGTFLRRSSLDELPQLWNVLTGSMSLVGPRPIVAAEVEKYGDSFASYCAVKPGITGLWQISGRSSTSYEQRVSLDRKYAETWTFVGDLVILCRTPFSVIHREGAY
jgi:lipopolysaccharide/colanic/teichoic acid biosynthesis glycosyltransferase